MTRRVLAAALCALVLSACDTRSADPVAEAPSPPSVSPTPSTSPTPAPPKASPIGYVGRPATYPSVGALGRELANAEQVIRASNSSAIGVRDAAQRQQAAYRQLVVTPAWRAAARAAVAASHRPAFDANLRAATELRALTRPRASLPRWLIVAAPALAELRGFYAEAERASGIDWSYLAAIHLVETRFGRLRGISTAGARGPMQFLPSTWAEVGRGDIDDPRDAILAAARYLVARGGRRDIARGLYGYNPSMRYVRAVSAYASVLQREPTALRGYYEWQVYYRMTTGDVVLRAGYRG